MTDVGVVSQLNLLSPIWCSEWDTLDETREARMTKRPEIEFGPTYVQLLEEIKSDVRESQYRVRRIVNTELVDMYWRIGKRILDRQETEGWGTKVIDRLAADLKAALPGARGFSRSNMKYMRQLAIAHPDSRTIGQQLAGQLPWGHWMVLLDKHGSAPDVQLWYAAQAVERGWSRAVLLNMVQGQLHARQGAAPSNFRKTLPPADSELAQQMTRDPYLLDFLGIADPTAERDLEDALCHELERFLLELGTGFAFVGRQYPVRVEGAEYALDLLFFNWKLDCFVALEIQITGFDPDHAGRLAFYTSWIDDQLRQPHHKPTIGIVVCASKNSSVVRYSLTGISSPMAVSTYNTLPQEVQAALPDAEELQQLVDKQLDQVRTNETLE